jgi:hypothetical protein
MSTTINPTRILPIPVTDIDVAFGGKAMDILPPYSEIPEEFHRGSNPWVKWQSEWFFKGLQSFPKVKEGIDADMAIKNLRCVQGSWAPKHEHKQAGVAYLASLWLEAPTEA